MKKEKTMGFLEQAGYKILAHKQINISFVNFAEDYKIKVPAVAFPGIGWDSEKDINCLPVSSDIKKLRARDVIVLPVCDEIVVVKSVSYKNKTIDLYSRGFGSTSPYRQGIKSFVFYIAGHFTKKEIDRAMRPIKFNN